MYVVCFGTVNLLDKDVVTFYDDQHILNDPTDRIYATIQNTKVLINVEAIRTTFNLSGDCVSLPTCFRYVIRVELNYNYIFEKKRPDIQRNGFIWIKRFLTILKII